MRYNEENEKLKILKNKYKHFLDFDYPILLFLQLIYNDISIRYFTSWILPGIDKLGIFIL